MLAKNAVKWGAGLGSIAFAHTTDGSLVGRACILNYHRISVLGCSDWSTDSWNVAPSRFERHLQLLAKEAECVPLESLFERLQNGRNGKPIVALTFDDGFANFHANVLPLLSQYRIPATLFLVTKYVGTSVPYPFDRWGWRNSERAPHEAWRPITWAEVEQCVSSGLVSIGSHSHSHRHASGCPDEALREEVFTSREILTRHLGERSTRLYSYPYGLSRDGGVRPVYAEALRDAGFRLAVTTNLGLVDPSAELLMLPRVEVHAFDSPAVVRAKVMGCLGPYRLLDRLRHSPKGVKDGN